MSHMIITAGGSGSGKGHVVANLHPDAHIIDADSFKESHPDYDAKNPQALHAWSSQEVTRAIYTALGTGRDFIYDGTGRNAEKIAQHRND